MPGSGLKAPEAATLQKLSMSESGQGLYGRPPRNLAVGSLEFIKGRKPEDRYIYV